MTSHDAGFVIYVGTDIEVGGYVRHGLNAIAIVTDEQPEPYPELYLVCPVPDLGLDDDLVLSHVVPAMLDALEEFRPRHTHVSIH